MEIGTAGLCPWLCCKDGLCVGGSSSLRVDVVVDWLVGWLGCLCVSGVCGCVVGDVPFCGWVSCLWSIGDLKFDTLLEDKWPCSPF